MRLLIVSLLLAISTAVRLAAAPPMRGGLRIAHHHPNLHRHAVAMCAAADDIDARLKELEDALQTLEADGMTAAELSPLKEQIDELRSLQVSRVPSPPSPALRKLDDTLFGLEADGIPAEQLLPLKQQIEELRAMEGAAPAERPATAAPPSTDTSSPGAAAADAADAEAAAMEPSSAMKNAMSAIFGTFGVTARDLDPEETAQLERREAAAREAREAAAAEAEARKALDTVVVRTRTTVDALSDAVLRATVLRDQMKRDGSDALRFLGEARRDEKRTALQSTIDDLGVRVDEAQTMLEEAGATSAAANDGAAEIAAEAERAASLRSQAAEIASEIAALGEEREAALVRDS